MSSRGFSLVGMLVTLVCMVVLFAIGMSALDKAVTGEGSAVEGTVHSVKDQIYLHALHQSMFVYAQENRDRFITPSGLSGSDDPALDTTANLFSAMVMQNYAPPAQLVSANEFSGYVEVDEDYDFRQYAPAAGVYWDPAFRADLNRLSNVSFAHLPLAGERAERYWQASLGARVPILGNRGPKDGIDDPTSWTYGRSGVWGGHLVFGDGHTDFTRSFTPTGVFFERDGQRYPDNIFAVEDGPLGVDAILSFTAEMSPDGAVLQWD